VVEDDGEEDYRTANAEQVTTMIFESDILGCQYCRGGWRGGEAGDGDVVDGRFLLFLMRERSGGCVHTHPVLCVHHGQEEVDRSTLF
jgi:hypothetical protein